MQASLLVVLEEIGDLEFRIKDLEKQLAEIGKQHEVVRRLMTIPGVGLITATAFVGSVSDIHGFRRGRQFSAWLGITPREYSSGNNRYLGRISKRGDGYLRMLLIHGARSALLAARRKQASDGDLSRLQHWAVTLNERAHHNTTAVALANKMARTIWAYGREVKTTRDRR